MGCPVDVLLQFRNGQFSEIPPGQGAVPVSRSRLFADLEVSGCAQGNRASVPDWLHGHSGHFKELMIDHICMRVLWKSGYRVITYISIYISYMIVITTRSSLFMSGHGCGGWGDGGMGGWGDGWPNNVLDAMLLMKWHTGCCAPHGSSTWRDIRVVPLSSLEVTSFCFSITRGLGKDKPIYLYYNFW